eukprot:TRINITY_DN20006_c0_g1_i1.p2 TRINITY_DN20006_c0_g1~~TRINITY_DN20006_c0_g1_i1.p2  ORF type:complete len:247 (+),score=57.23 TRINITY_DN20006_c0_g1_i1:71-742(+)
MQLGAPQWGTPALSPPRRHPAPGSSPVWSDWAAPERGPSPGAGALGPVELDWARIDRLRCEYRCLLRSARPAPPQPRRPAAAAHLVAAAGAALPAAQPSPLQPRCTSPAADRMFGFQVLPLEDCSEPDRARRRRPPEEAPNDRPPPPTHLDEDIPPRRAAFLLWDTDGSGRISEVCIADALAAAGYRKVNLKEVLASLSGADPGVTYAQFEAVCNNLDARRSK